MSNEAKCNVLNYQKKERRKIIRSILQVILFFILIIIVAKEIFFLQKYEPAVHGASDKDSGFIALSYFGIDRTGTPKYVAKEKLDKQLTALHNQGYVTVSQQDIINYYTNGKKLPEKALFLAFEDGRNDSSIFAQDVLEKLNYKATIYTYSNKMGVSDTKFLQPDDLKSLQSSEYWEIGSNGNRLTYINVFDSNGNPLGMIDENEIPDKTKIEYYNHYLMDFIRDEFMIPVETRTEMEKRIRHEYSTMQKTYKSSLGFVPKTYAIMHANSLYHDMNSLVEDVNNQEIRNTFQMHFNLEGDAYNGKNTDLYNLSRLQVSPYWSTNHLLMKIQKDSEQQIQFQLGNKEIAKDWSITRGAAEFVDHQIILTSPPSEEGLIVLNEEIPSNYSLDLTLKGNIVGEQNVYLRYDEVNNTYLKLSLKNNSLFVFEKLKNKEEEQIALYSLDEVTWDGEDYAFNKATNYSYQDTQAGSRIDEEEYPRTIPGNRKINLTLANNKLRIVIDNGDIDKTVKLDTSHTSNKFALGSLYVEKKTSYEQYADGIYDAIFEEITITSNGTTVYSNAYNGIEKVFNKTEEVFNIIVDYFIETF